MLLGKELGVSLVNYWNPNTKGLACLLKSLGKNTSLLFSLVLFQLQRTANIDTSAVFTYKLSLEVEVRRIE